MMDMVVDAPWERVEMNLTGKHPRSRWGNYYILTYLDHFTKFAKAYHIPNKEPRPSAGFWSRKSFRGSGSLSSC